MCYCHRPTIFRRRNRTAEEEGPSHQFFHWMYGAASAEDISISDANTTRRCLASCILKANRRRLAAHQKHQLWTEWRHAGRSDHSIPPLPDPCKLSCYCVYRGKTKVICLILVLTRF